MADESRPVFTHTVWDALEEKRLGNYDEKLATLAALREPVTANDLAVAREEYGVRLLAARDAVRRRDALELIEEERAAADVCRTRYEYLLAAYRAQAEEAQANEARELAKTNTKLAESQTKIAKAVAGFTFLQLALAFAQAMKWLP